MIKEYLQKIGGKIIGTAKDAPKGTLELLTSEKAQAGKLPKQDPEASTRSGTQRRLVIVDGVLMDVPEFLAIGLVKSGFWSVVWPGTRIRVNKGESKGGYPPDWISPYIP